MTKLIVSFRNFANVLKHNWSASMDYDVHLRHVSLDARKKTAVSGVLIAVLLKINPLNPELNPI